MMPLLNYVNDHLHSPFFCHRLLCYLSGVCLTWFSNTIVLFRGLANIAGPAVLRRGERGGASEVDGTPEGACQVL